MFEKRVTNGGFYPMDQSTSHFDSFTWHNNIEALAQRFKGYVPDLWGFGFSTRVPFNSARTRSRYTRVGQGDAIGNLRRCES